MDAMLRIQENPAHGLRQRRASGLSRVGDPDSTRAQTARQKSGQSGFSGFIRAFQDDENSATLQSM
jgi:hypothetical protein